MGDAGEHFFRAQGFSCETEQCVNRARHDPAPRCVLGEPVAETPLRGFAEYERDAPDQATLPPDAEMDALVVWVGELRGEVLDRTVQLGEMVVVEAQQMPTISLQ